MIGISMLADDAIIYRKPDWFPILLAAALLYAAGAGSPNYS
jgi:hypothetical protein